MAEDEVVVARIVGDELRVERYEFRQRSVTSISCPEAELEGHVRRLRPQLVVWTAPDARGRRLAKALQEHDAETAWRPGSIELPGWTELPFSELLRMVCQPSAEEKGRPPQPQAKVEIEPGEDVPRESDVLPEAPRQEARPTEEKPDDLGHRLELILAVRAGRSPAPSGKAEEAGV